MSNGDFVGNVEVVKGSIGSIWVSKGNFTLPENAVVLVSALKGDVGNVSVSGNIGGKVSESVFGQIVGQTIGTIRSVNKSILVQTIHSTSGNIKAVYATNGILKSAVLAEKGNISLIDAKQVAGNITAKANRDNPGNDGSIGVITSAELIPQSVTITAERYLTSIIVTGLTNKDVEKFKVFLAAGSYLIQGNSNTLRIDLGQGAFLGTVSFGSNAALVKNGQAPTFENTDILLSLIAGKKETRWVFQGPPLPATTTVAALFTELKGDIFGSVSKQLKINAGFALNGPSGVKAD